MTKQIIENNVRLMRSAEAGGMWDFVQKRAESLGRSAYWEGGKAYTTVAPTFVYELSTGKIVAFTLVQYFSAEIREGIEKRVLSEATFRIALKPGSALGKIVEVVYEKRMAQPSEEAMRVIDASIAEYNANSGW